MNTYSVVGLMANDNERQGGTHGGGGRARGGKAPEFSLRVYDCSRDGIF